MSKEALGAVLCPYEVVSEPWLVAMGYAESAILNGVEIRLNSKVTGAEYADKLWTIGVTPSDIRSIPRSSPGEILTSNQGITEKQNKAQHYKIKA